MVQITPGDKATLYSAAVIEAIAVAGKEIGSPDINAAIAALMHATAYIIAKIEDPALRRTCEAQAIDTLPAFIAAEVNARIIREQAEGKPNA